MSKFKAKSIILLKREKPSPGIIRAKNEPHFWYLIRGNIKKGFWGLYKTFQKAYGAIEDKGRIVKIRIEVTREK